MQTKENVLNLLKNHRESKAALNMLKLQLDGFQGITFSEAIDALTFHHSEGECVQSSGISNKTAAIALNYADYAKKLNDEARQEILLRLAELQQRTGLLETAMDGLSVSECTVITGFYFEHKSMSQMAGELAVAERTIRRYREAAIDRLVSIYDRYSDLTTGGTLKDA